MLDEFILKICKNKNGVEIGGPSKTGINIYKNVSNIDNVVFSNSTIWAKLNNEYRFKENVCGKVIINDAVDIKDIKDKSYDFLFSSHCLEHIANPIKALNEWKRITIDGAYIILILPEKSACFDHRREISKFEVLKKQYEKNVGDNDLSTLKEILKLHDLTKDPGAGNLRNFYIRSLNNYKNRCLHHYVYNKELQIEICDYINCDFVYSITEGLNIWFIMKKL